MADKEGVCLNVKLFPKLPTSLFLILFSLKLGIADTEVQQWSWWWVTCPLWGLISLFVIGFVTAFIVLSVASLTVSLIQRIRGE